MDVSYIGRKFQNDLRHLLFFYICVVPKTTLKSVIVLPLLSSKVPVRFDKG